LRLLITGKSGQLGWELAQVLHGNGEMITTDRNALDLTNAGKIATFIRQSKPDVIVNAAAYTDVDKAESEAELARAVNATAPGIMAEAAKEIDATLIHYSTDYVFDGEKKTPYAETDKPRPLNIYGASKLEGEQAIADSGCRFLILRTSWVYSPRGHNFMLTMLRLLRDRNEVTVVTDQMGAPTSSRMIANATRQALRQKNFDSGVYHLAAAGHTSWYGFANLIAEYVDPPVARITSINSQDYATIALRPANSRLDCRRFEASFHLSMRDWESEARDILRGMQEGRARNHEVRQ
jgi:dTDP-4-dehydrorhamnose reductase